MANASIRALMRNSRVRRVHLEMRKIDHLRHFLRLLSGAETYLGPDLVPTLTRLDVNDFPHGAADAGRAESGRRCGILRIST